MSIFKEKIAKLGFARMDNFGDYKLDECLFLCNAFVDNADINLHLDEAHKLKASAVFFIEELTKLKPQVYLYDFTSNSTLNSELVKIQTQIWSSGVVPIACVFDKTEVIILDCTQPTDGDKPQYLEKLNYSEKATSFYNEQFAIKIKTGTFWELTENKDKFKFSKSAYNVLLNWIKVIITKTEKLNIHCSGKIIKKVIVQAIMIKYFEERKDDFWNSPFSEEYYQHYFKESCLVSILRNGNHSDNDLFIKLLYLLSQHFNGNLFNWSDEEKVHIHNLNLIDLVEALDGYRSIAECENLRLIRYYDFSCVPVELISRIYEEFLAGENQKNKKRVEGIFYTPSHLANLLIDEVMPISRYDKVNLSDFRVLDPACGSGIFLALAFKRLVQWWRLQNNMMNPKVEDLKTLQKCIYGVDKEEQAVKLTAFSLCFALSDELSPKVMVSELKFDDLTETNIIHSDFFIDEYKEPDRIDLKENFTLQKKKFAALYNQRFDIVIGNPPFKSMGENLSQGKADLILLLMDTKLKRGNYKDVTFAILDVERKKLFDKTKLNNKHIALLEGEALSFINIWNSFEN